MQKDSVPVLFIYLFLLFITLCVYTCALNNAFIFDDEYVVVKNLYIKNISLIPKLFKVDIFHFQHPENQSMGIYYRPLQGVSYAFDYFFWKLNPAGYRMVNIIIHSINGLLIYLIVSLIFKNKPLSLLTAILFCIHPIQTSDVSFISVRAVPLAMFFMLLSVMLILNYFLHQKKIYYFLSLSSFVFAFLSWEMALILPFFIVLFAFFTGVDRRKLYLGLLPFIFVCVIYLIFRSKFMPCDKLMLKGTFTLNNLKGFCYYALDYVAQLILPAGSQKFIFGDSLIWKTIFFFFCLGITALSLIKAVIFRNREITFALIFYFIGILPLIRLWETARMFGPVGAEHYVYIGSVGIFIMISYLILDLSCYFRKIALILIIGLVALYSSLTIINNANYKDDIAFYNHLASLDNRQTFFKVNLGTAYYKKKMYRAAAREAGFALAAEPSSWEAGLLLGNIYLAKGELEKALELYKKVLILYPKSSEALNNIALIYKSQGKYKEAYEFFTKALQTNPESLLALKNFTDLLIKDRLYSQAAQNCKMILTINPGDIDGHVLLGIISAESGHLKEAETFFKKALELDSASFDALKNLGVLYANMGDLDKAILVWEKAKTLGPSNEEIESNLKEARRLKRSRER